MNATSKALLLVIAAVAVAGAQTATTPPPPPAPPACLSGPVTSGNVTLTCSMIDATGGSDTNFAAPGVYLLAVRATSIDPGVNAIQTQISYLQSADPASATMKRSVTILKNAAGAFSYVFIIPGIYDATGTVLAAPPLAPITIQELKPSSSQSF